MCHSYIHIIRAGQRHGRDRHDVSELNCHNLLVMIRAAKARAANKLTWRNDKAIELQ